MKFPNKNYFYIIRFFLKKIRLFQVGEEIYMPTNQVGIPIIVNIVLIFGYIFLGAMVRKYNIYC